MLLRLIIAAVLVAPAFSAWAAETYPARPIRIVLTYVPGGNTDNVARLVSPYLTEQLGQPIVIDNRGGAGGVVGTDIAAHAAPDGYTLLFGTSGGLVVNPLMHTKLPYDVERDFAPVSLVVVLPQLLVTYPGLPAKNVAEFLKLARAQPGKINYASVGVGSPNHLGMELLKSMTGIDIVHVPYKGSSPAVIDLIAGNVSVLFSSIPVMLAHARAGRLRALAVGSAKRSPAAPEIPTVAESGVPGFEYVTWYGVFAPSRVPHAIVARLNDAVVKSLRSPQLEQQLRGQGADPRPTTAEEVVAFMKVERVRWEKVVKATGLEKSLP
jgi:tripartite-type tricarboxylate transporter receptor subunit TctC